jgi:hypothetical protein
MDSLVLDELPGEQGKGEESSATCSPGWKLSYKVIDRHVVIFTAGSTTASWLYCKKSLATQRRRPPPPLLALFFGLDYNFSHLAFGNRGANPLLPRNCNR